MHSIQNCDPADEGTRKMSRKFSEIQFPGLAAEASPVNIVPCSKDVVLEEKESRHSNSTTWNKVGRVKVDKIATIYILLERTIASLGTCFFLHAKYVSGSAADFGHGESVGKNSRRERAGQRPSFAQTTITNGTGSDGKSRRGTSSHTRHSF